MSPTNNLHMLRLSKKADYALIAMKHLALRPDQTAASAREILASRKPLRFDLSGRVMAVDGRPFPEARFEERDR